jgi:hypothetical protein
MTCAKLTNYVHIFSKVYWGGHPHNDPGITSEIITNRNNFILDYDIVRVKELSHSQLGLDWVDYYSTLGHMEGYKAGNGDIIVVVSIYGEPKALALATLRYLGFDLYAKLYHTGAYTFVADYKSISEARQLSSEAQLLAKQNKLLWK